MSKSFRTGISVSGSSIFSGSLTASFANISGSITTASITSTSGSISGWVLSNIAFTAGSGASATGFSSSPDSSGIFFYAGGATASSAPLRITSTGNITASAGTHTFGATTVVGAFSASTVDSTAGWTTFPASATYSSTSASGTYGIAQYRLLGNKVELRGAVQKVSGSVVDADVIGTMPVGTRPNNAIRVAVNVNNTPYSGRITSGSGGNVLIATSATTATIVHLDGVSYYINN